MAVDRVENILSRLATRRDGEAGPAALCRVGREVLATSGTGMLLLSDPDLRVSVDGGDEVVARLHRSQMDLGEGPGLDAHSEGVPVFAPHLEGDRRWPAFAPAAVHAGACAVFSVPARVGSARLGSFTAWQVRPGALTDDQHADLLVFGEVAARLLLDTQVETSPAGPVLVGDQGIEFDHVVHQAAGMLSVQLGVSLHTALLRLRAHAFATDLPVAEAAKQVVARRVRLEPDHLGEGSMP